jgi:hypothetical protein
MKGRCFCGTVQINASAPPVAVRSCWCRDCQYLGAGSATVNAIFRNEQISIDGELANYESVAHSGSKMTRSFCPHCGTAVSSRSSTRPDFVVLRVGLFDDRENLSPSLTIWTDSAPAWGCWNKDVPSTPRQPAPIG